MWSKQCHKPLKNGNGKHTMYLWWFWGMVYGIVSITLAHSIHWSKKIPIRYIFPILRHTHTDWWFGFFPYVGNNHPNWRTHIFQRGPNHQPSLDAYMVYDLFIVDFIEEVGWVKPKQQHDREATTLLEDFTLPKREKAAAMPMCQIDPSNYSL